MKLFRIALKIAIGLFLLPFANAYAGGNLPALSQNSKYLIGLGQFTQNSNINSQSAAALLKQVAHIEYIQHNWNESKTSDGTGIIDVLKPDVEAARKEGLKVFLSMEVLSYDRKKSVLPPGLSGDFSTPAVQESYLKMAREIAVTFKPEYLVLSIEVNIYKTANPKDYRAFVDLYKKAYAEVKKLSPESMVAVSLVYIDANNKDCYDLADLKKVKEDAADFAGHMDMLAVSIYPFCYFDPSRMPENFYEQLAGITDLPLFISETGWVSEGFKLGNGYPFPGSQEAQAKFIERISQLADYAVRKDRKVAAVNYIALIDPESCDWVVKVDPSLIWFCTLALRDGANRPKSAYNAMKKWKKRLDEQGLP